MNKYRVVVYNPASPLEAVEFLDKIDSQGYELITVEGSYFYFKKKESNK